MMRVLSNVYPPEIKPVRDGWYLTRRHGTSIEMLTEYRGGVWYCPVRGANLVQTRRWRGLAFCPYSAIATTHTDVSIASQRVYEIEGVFVPGASCC